MINQGYAYNSPKDSGTTRIVAITAVNASARKASGMTRERSTIEIDTSFPVGGMLVTPAVGEQWYVERLGLKYVLSSRLPSNQAALLTEAQEGQVQVGSTGPLTLHGSEVQVESSLRLGDTLYRDTGGSLERSTDDGTTWAVALGASGPGSGGGSVLSVSGKVGEVLLEIGDIANLAEDLGEKADLVGGKVPDTQIRHRVLQFASDTDFPPQGSADTLYLDSADKEVYAWVGGSYVVIGSAEAAAQVILGPGATPLDLEAFFNGFLPGAGTLLDQIIDSITALLGGDLSDLSGILPGLGDLLTQIVQAITGVVGGGLQDLGKFFEGFLGFDPIEGVGTLLNQIVKAITGWATGGLTDLGQFFEGFLGFDPVQGINSLLKQLGKGLTGLPSLLMDGLKDFFGNIRKFLGNVDFLPSGNFNLLDAAQTFINSILNPTGILSKLADLQQWLTGVIGGGLQGFFSNIRAFLGNINFLPSGAFNLLDAAQTFINSILNPTGILSKLADLQQWLTGVVGGGLQTFFGNIRAFFGSINFLPGGNFNLLEAAQTFINSILNPTGILSRLADLQQWLTGAVGGGLQTFFSNIRAFLGNFNFLSGSFSVGSAADTFINSILNPRNILANLASLQTWLTGTVGGSLQSFFTNVRTFLGSINFLDGSFNPLEAVKTFINSMLAPANAAVKKFANLIDDLIPDGLIPILEPGKIRDLIVGLTGNLTGNIKTFFDNIRTFLGSINFLDGSFNPSAAIQTFINSMLAPANAVVKKFANLIDDLIPDGLIPILEPGKIKDLIVSLTGNLTGNIKTFFDNIRTFLGSINFLDGSFNPSAAIQTFINSMLAPANAVVKKFAGLIDDLIPDGLIPILEPGKIKDLIISLTGNLTGNIKTFFDNIRTFLGSINFLDGSFNPSAAIQTFINSMLAPANAVVKKFAGLVNDLIPDGLIPILEPGKIKDLIISLTGNLTGNIKTFFDNIRTFLGSINFLDGSFNPATAVQTFITSMLAPANATVKKFAGLINDLIPDGLIPILEPGKIKDLIIGLTGNLTGNIKTFFDNIRTFLGSFDFLSGSFTPGAAAQTFINSILAPANATAKKFAGLVNDLIPDGLIPKLEIGKVDLLQAALDARVIVDDLVSKITGAVSGGMTAVQNFFAGFSPFSGSNSIVNQLTNALMGTGDTLTRLRTFFSGFDPFDGVNSIIKQIGNALSGSGIAGASITAIRDFFGNIRTFLGSINFLATPANFATSLGTNIDNFIDSILKPRNKFTAVSDLAAYLGGGAVEDIERFFKNITSLFSGLGLRTTTPTSFNPLASGAAFINNIFAQASSTINSLIPNLTSEKIGGLVSELASKAGITALVQNITGLVNGSLSNLSAFFTGLPDPFNPANGATSLVQQFVKQITGSAGVMDNIKNFFGNVRTFLGSFNFLTAPGSFSISSAAETFINSVLAPVNNTIRKFAPLNGQGFLDLGLITDFTVEKVTGISDWVRDNFFRPIVTTLTGFGNLFNITDLNTWARERLSKFDPLASGNLIGNIASHLLGIIPVSHISKETPNLLTGSFDSATVTGAGNGWSWDGTMADASGDTGSARVTVSSALSRTLSSAQVPVSEGDQINASAWIKTSGLVATSTHTVTLGAPTAGSFRLIYDGVTSTSIAHNASAATVQSALVAMSSIGAGKAVVTGTAGNYSITITGTANRLTATSTLTGGTASVTSTCPLSVVLVPYIGQQAQAAITISTTGASTPWFRITGSNYTVPANVTSVLVRIGVSAAVTAGSVWWSDISLVKSGLLKQSLVDRLGDAWNNLWSGIFGGGGINRTVDDILIAAGAISSAAGTADANGKTAIVRIQDLLTGLLNAPATVIGNIGTVLMDGTRTVSTFLNNLWEGFSGLVATGGNKNILEVIDKLVTVRNTANTASATASGAQGSIQTLLNNLLNAPAAVLGNINTVLVDGAKTMGGFLSSLWEGFSGLTSGATPRSVLDVIGKLILVRNTANTADANASGAQNSIQILLSNLLNAPAAVLGNIGTVLVDGTRTMSSFLTRLWEGFSGLTSGATPRNVLEVIDKLITVRNTANTASATASGAQGSIQTLLNNLLNAPATVLGNIGSVLVDGTRNMNTFLTSLWEGFSGLTSGGATRNVLEVIDKLITVRNTANTASATASGAQGSIQTLLNNLLNAPAAVIGNIGTVLVDGTRTMSSFLTRLWEGFSGLTSGTTPRNVLEVIDKLVTVRNTANTASSNASGAQSSIQTLLGNLLNAPATVLGNIGTVLVDGTRTMSNFLTRLWEGFSGLTSGTTPRNVLEVIEKLGLVRNTANTADANSTNAQSRITGLLGNLLSAPAAVIGNIGTVLVDGVRTMSGFLTGLWEGFSGLNSGAITRSALEVIEKLGLVRNTANTADANSTNAQSRITGLLGNLLSAPGSVIGTIGTVLVDGVRTMGGFLTGLWEGFSGLGAGGGGKSVLEVIDKLGLVRNTANDAYANADTGITRAAAAQTTANEAQDLSVLNASDLALLKATSLPGAASASDLDNFDYNSTALSSTLWATSSSTANAGYYRTDGAKAYWVDQGGAANLWLARFKRLATTSSYQIVTAVMASPVTEAPVLGLSPEAYVYLLGRADASLANYVYARVGHNSISIWKKLSGQNAAQIGSSASYTCRMGDTIQFLCGTDGGGIRQFQVKINNSTVLTQTDTAGTLSVENVATNNFAGFGGYAAERFGGQSTPGALALWSLAENYPDPLVGSGFRSYRSDATNVANVTAGNQTFPTNWFSQLDQKTTDLAFDPVTSRVTVSVEGWYQVQFVAAGTASSFGIAAGGPVRALLYRGGPALAETPVQSGPARPANNNVGGFLGVDGNFVIYLKPGEWVRPGYNSSWSTPSGTNVRWTGDTAGLQTWLSLSLTNRSYN